MTSNGHIVSLYERRNRLEVERANAAADLKEFYAECKGNGYEPKALKAAFKRLDLKDDADANEYDALVDLYFEALLTDGAP